MTQEQHKEDVYQMCRDNHIWLNTFTLIRPTEETYIRIGKMVVDMLNNKENLMPAYYGEAEAAKELAALMPMLYLSINKS